MDQPDDFESPLGDDATSIWLNDLFENARLPGSVEELSSEAEVVGAMARTIAQPSLVVDINARRRRSISKPAARTAIVAAALLVGTSTAAATGNLPDRAQSAVARASSHLGLDIPDPYDERGRDEHNSTASTTDPSTTDPSTTSSMPIDAFIGTVPVGGVQSTNGGDTSTSSSAAVPDSTELSDGQAVPTETTVGPGPDAAGPAKQGLCRAWAAHGDNSPANQNSTAMKNLRAAAAAAGQTVAEFCADVLGPESTEVATATSEATPDTTVDGDEKKAKKDKKEKGSQESEKEKKNKK